MPLHSNALQEKTYIRWDDGDTERLVQDGDHQAELEKVFKLAKYPSAMTWGTAKEFKLNEYMNDLKCATDVGLGGLASEQAVDSFMEFHRNKTM